MIAVEMNMGARIQIDLAQKVADIAHVMEKYGFKEPVINSTVIIYSKSKNERITIFPNQISFLVDSDFKKDDLKQYANFYKEVIALLFRQDDVAGFTLRFIDINSNKKFNYMDTSLSKCGISTDYSDVPGGNIKGIGYRFLIEEAENIYNEFKVEPLLRDTSSLYFEGIYNVINMEDIFNTQYYIDKYGDFCQKRNYFLEKING